MPVLAAARKPPEKTIAGTPYNQEYSGGSVGRLNMSSMRCVAVNLDISLQLGLEYLGDDEASSDVDASEQDGDRA